jgi:hypothetical protein
MDENYLQVRLCKVNLAGRGSARVYILDGKSHIVNSAEKTCTYEGFQEILTPCRHAIAACLREDLDPYEYVDDWHTVRTVWAGREGSKSTPSSLKAATRRMDQSTVYQSAS